MSWWLPEGKIIDTHEVNDFRKKNFLLHCTTCNNVYEDYYDNPLRRMIQIKYEDFPTIGLERKQCKRCNEG